MVVGHRSLAWRLAFWGTVSSVLGGAVGYAIGYGLYESLGLWIINTYHLHDAFQKFQKGFSQYGFWIIVLKGLTPIPYKLVTIASGVASFSFGWFILASVFARAIRFYMLASLLWFFGPWAKKWIDDHFGVFCLVTVGSVILGFGLVKAFG